MVRFKKLVCWLGIGVRTEGGICDFTVPVEKIITETEKMQPFDEKLEERIYELESRVSLVEQAAIIREQHRQEARHA